MMLYSDMDMKIAKCVLLGYSVVQLSLEVCGMICVSRSLQVMLVIDVLLGKDYME